MSSELDILQLVAANPSISQRKIAAHTGLSLGQVNFLIKKFAKKGYIKIEGQSPKSIQYNLTPKGISEKAALTLEYVRLSYLAVIRLTQKIKSLVNQYPDDYSIIIYGSNDEMMEICRITLGESEVEYIDIKDTINLSSGKIVFFWEEEAKKSLEAAGVKAVNILS